ncbi:MAG TPA: sugar phosphate isomerase/epimerase family protein [Planctomycetota bacterium]|jgi:D-psicose/D-tagatose/L-ribulose 3-epimerase
MGIAIGINAWVWTAPVGDNVVPLIKKAAKMGFDCFEIPIEDPAAFNADKIKAALEEAGIKAVTCGAFGPSRDLTSDDPKFRQESLDYIAAAVKLAEKWGSKVLAGPAYSAVGKRRQVSPAQKKKEWDLAVKGLKKAGKIAADHGVTIAIEPLNRFETDLINTAEQAIRLVKEVDSPGVGVHLDTFHMHIEEKCSYDAIRRAGKLLKHVHLCENDRGAPGSGQVHWDIVAKALKEVKYGGACVIESFTPECKSIAAAAAIWRPLCKDQDTLAKEGLKHLRKILG